VEPSYFFDPIGVLVKDSVVEAPQFPESRFYYWKSRSAATNDVILLSAMTSRPAKAMSWPTAL